MKLSSAYLAKYIEGSYSILDQYGLSGKDGYLRPLLGSGADGHVGVVRQKQFDEMSEDEGADKFWVVIVQTGAAEISEEKKQRDWCWILVGDALGEKSSEVFPYVSDAACLLNDLQFAFDEADGWKERLEQSIKSENGITGMVKVCSEFLGNPVTLIGQDFSVLCEAGTDGLDPQHRIFEEDNINPAFLKHLLSQHLVMEQAGWPCIFPAFPDGCRTVILGIRRDKDTVFLLIVTEVKAVGEWDFCILNEFREYLLYELLHEPSTLETGGISEVLHMVLTDRTADYVQSSRRLTRLGWEVADTYYCIVLRNMYQDSNTISNQVISKYIGKHFQASCTVEIGHDIVVFFNVNKMGTSTEEIENQMRYFIRDSYLKAGYGRGIHGHMNLRRQYLQARTALELGEKLNPYQWIYRFNQVILPYIMEKTTKQLPWYMVCHEGVLALQQSDLHNNTEYLETLRAYLDHHMSATTAANALYIHRSTFLYRMERIKAILQSNLEDPDELFYLDFSLRLIKNEEQGQK